MCVSVQVEIGVKAFYALCKGRRSCVRNNIVLYALCDAGVREGRELCRSCAPNGAQQYTSSTAKETHRQENKKRCVGHFEGVYMHMRTC